MIEIIRLWNRSDTHAYRLGNFHIFVSDVPFTSTVIADVQNQPGVLDIFHAGGNGRDRKFGIGRTGRYVRVQLEAKQYLTIAEVEVYVNPTGGQASLLSGDEEVLVTAIAPRFDIEAIADEQFIVDTKGGMTPTLRPSFFRGPLEMLPGGMRVVVSWANRQTVEHALTIDAISDDLASDALAESTLREERRTTSGERRGLELASLGLSDQAGVVGSAESVTGERRYNLYSPEMNLLSETEYTDAATPPIQYDYVWFAGAPVAQVTHSVPLEPLPAPEVVWTVTDHLGTPRIQTDSTGAIVWHAEHEPYGRIYILREGEGRHQPLRFPGQEAEQLGVNAANGITDRNYNIFRWYRAAEGRYTQADPIAAISDANVFRYAYANPVSLSDPSGLVTWKCNYMFATANKKPLGEGAGVFAANCTSECVGGKQVSATLGSTAVGASAGPFPVGATYFSTVSGEDGHSSPKASNLVGVFWISSFTLSAGPGMGCTGIVMGDFNSGLDCGVAWGLDFGLDTYIGYTFLYHKTETCC